MPRLRPQPPPQKHHCDDEGKAIIGFNGFFQPLLIIINIKLGCFLILMYHQQERFHQNRIMMREKSPMSSRGQFVELPPIPSSSQPTAKPVQQTVAQQMPKDVRTMNHYKKEEEKAPEKKSAYFSPIAFGCSQPRGEFVQQSQTSLLHLNS